MAEATSELDSLSSIVASWNTYENGNGINIIDDSVCKQKCPLKEICRGPLSLL